MVYPGIIKSDIGIAQVCDWKSRLVTGKGTHVSWSARRQWSWRSLEVSPSGQSRKAGVGAKIRSAGRFQCLIFLYYRREFDDSFRHIKSILKQMCADFIHNLKLVTKK